jgi:hypothetical protein
VEKMMIKNSLSIEQSKNIVKKEKEKEKERECCFCWASIQVSFDTSKK